MLEGTTQIVSTAQYGAAGEMLQMDGETYRYNDRLQLIGMRKVNSSNQVLFDTDYVYPAPGYNNGQIEQTVDRVSGETVLFQYDELQRLVKAETGPSGPQWGAAFSYDGFGNRTEQRSTKGAIPMNLSFDLKNRVVGERYAYNERGDLTAMPKGAGTLTLEYDFGSRLTKAWDGAAGEEYRYAPDNRRVYQKVLPAGTEYFYFFLGAQVLGKYGVNKDASGNLTSVHDGGDAPLLRGAADRDAGPAGLGPCGREAVLSVRRGDERHGGRRI